MTTGFDWLITPAPNATTPAPIRDWPPEVVSDPGVPAVVYGCSYKREFVRMAHMWLYSDGAGRTQVAFRDKGRLVSYHGAWNLTMSGQLDMWFNCFAPDHSSTRSGQLRRCSVSQPDPDGYFVGFDDRERRIRMRVENIFDLRGGVWHQRS